MIQGVTVIERAFQLAQSGNYETVVAIKDRLRREGYDAEQIMGGTLRAQLRALCRIAQSGRSEAPAPANDREASGP